MVLFTQDVTTLEAPTEDADASVFLAIVEAFT